MIFDELSNAIFRLSLRFLGAELEGGVRRPPPHQVVENPEAHQVSQKTAVSSWKRSTALPQSYHQKFSLS